LGIAKEEQAHIFERFYRGDASRQMGTPGTGLGLSICKEVIQRHGGEIKLRSTQQKGSTFSIWLPVDHPGNVIAAAG
jgi:signal transduction histidine kinase